MINWKYSKFRNLTCLVCFSLGSRFKLISRCYICVALYIGSSTVNQVSRKIANPTSKRSDGGIREVGPVSAGNVRRDTGRKSAGGSVRAYFRIFGGVLASHTSTRHARSQRTATVDKAYPKFAKHGHAHDDEQLSVVR